MTAFFQKNEEISRFWHLTAFEDSLLATEILGKKHILLNLFSTNLKFILILVFLRQRFIVLNIEDLNVCYEEWLATCYVMPNGVSD